jgi:chorismate synthase
MGNTFGTIFRVTTWGESHGSAVGAVIDGCPSGLELSEKDIQRELDRRRPGASKISSPRKEEDKAEILSGVFEGRTLGTAVSIIVRNKDARSVHYEDLRDVYRPGHGDYTWEAKYGLRDWRGGGRASARETVGRVAAGAIARKILASIGVEIAGYVRQIGDIKFQLSIVNFQSNANVQFSKSRIQAFREKVEDNIVRCPDEAISKKMIALIEQVRKEGDSVGGVVEVVAFGAPAGLGEPVFDKLSADIMKALGSIPAVKGVEIGSGFKCAAMRGSEHNDVFTPPYEGWVRGGLTTKTNNAGGILGGISNGMPIVARIAIKPASSISREQETVDSDGKPRTIRVHGRHDPCVVPRAVPIAESMLALVLADHWLRQRASKID